MISITICRVCQRCTRSISSWKVWRHLLSCDSRTWTKSWGSASVLWRKILPADMSQHWSPDTGQSGATSLSWIHLQRHETRKLSNWQLQGKKSLITALQTKCILLHSIVSEGSSLQHYLHGWLWSGSAVPRWGWRTCQLQEWETHDRHCSLHVSQCSPREESEQERWPGESGIHADIPGQWWTTLADTDILQHQGEIQENKELKTETFSRVIVQGK